MAEKAALAYLNSSLLRPYGRASRLRIDSAAKTIDLELVLKGETEPVEIFVSEYEISDDHGSVQVKLNGIRTSRQWLTALAENQVAGRDFGLPRSLGKLLLRYFGPD